MRCKIDQRLVGPIGPSLGQQGAYREPLKGMNRETIRLITSQNYTQIKFVYLYGAWEALVVWKMLSQVVGASSTRFVKNYVVGYRQYIPPWG